MMEQEKHWLTAGGILWGLQLITALILSVLIIKLNMLPGFSLAILLGLVAVSLLITFLLFFLKGDEQGSYGRRIAAVIVSLIMTIGFTFGSVVLGQALSALKTVTSNRLTPSAIGVYVPASDPAKTIQDAKAYTFSYSTLFDGENVEKALKDIEQQVSGVIDAVQYDQITAAVDALTSGEAGAVILPNSYVTLLEEIDGYEDFLDNNRLLYEYISPEEEQKPEPQPEQQPESDSHVQDGAFILYISGSDTRNEYLPSRGRSDVNLLAAINPNTHEVLLINTPRDYFVPNPAGNGALDKLTHCGNFGVENSIQALEDLYDINIDDYARINFTGFGRLIDAVGGVSVHSDVSFVMTHNERKIEVGENALNGAEALAFARERYKLANGDNDRGKNQMRIVTALIRKVTGSTSSVLLNYSEILSTMEGMFATSMTTDEISELVKAQVASGSNWSVHTFAVTGDGARDITYSAPGMRLYVMVPNYDTVEYASELMTKVLIGEHVSENDTVFRR